MDDKKVLVVCYSYSGNSLRLAQQLAEMHGWRLAEIHLRWRRSGLSGYVRCLLDSLMRRRPPIRYTGASPAAFDITVLISPVWAGRMASPMRSFLAQHGHKLRRAAVVSVMADRGAEGASREVSDWLHQAPLLSEAFLQREIEQQDPAYFERLRAMAQALTPAKKAAPVTS